MIPNFISKENSYLGLNKGNQYQIPSLENQTSSYSFSEQNNQKLKTFTPLSKFSFIL